MEIFDLQQIKRDNTSGRITFSMPKYLIKNLDEYCKNNALYKSKFVANVIANAIVSNDFTTSK
jgi:metal-responsive CopG/Arc/MetJ family transcriptional regulator